MHIIHNVCSRRATPSYSTFPEADTNILWQKQTFPPKDVNPLPPIVGAPGTGYSDITIEMFSPPYMWNK